MAARLKESLSTYRLLYFSPEPETGERICVGIVFQESDRTSLLFDFKLSKLRCLAPELDVALLRYLLQDLRIQFERNKSEDIEFLLQSFTPQFQTSEERGILVPLTESVRQRLMERFVLHRVSEGVIAGIEAPRVAREVTRHLREYFEKFHVPAKAILENATPLTLFGIKRRIRPVALAVTGTKTAFLIDGVDLNVQKASQVIRKANQIVHTFWQYKRIQRRLPLQELWKVGVVLNGHKSTSRTLLDAHDYAVDQLEKEADIAVDEHTGKGLDRLKSALSSLSN